MTNKRDASYDEDFLRDAYYDEEHDEERVVLGNPSRLYRVTRTKVGIPETNRFTATGSGTVSLTPIDEAGEPVAVKDWGDPAFVRSYLFAVRQNFECVRLLEDWGREAYPGEQLDDLRARLQGYDEDLDVLERMYRVGELGLLQDRIDQRLIAIEREQGLADGQLRRTGRTLPERYVLLKQRIQELAPAMERWNISVPYVIVAENPDPVVSRGR